MSAIDTTLLPVDGPAAPPRSNGELVFAEPWESRAFGLAFALYDGGHFTWDEFQAALITAIGDWERDHPDRDDWSYYRCWLDALERLIEQRGLLATPEVEERIATLQQRPPGHDH